MVNRSKLEVIKIINKEVKISAKEINSFIYKLKNENKEKIKAKLLNLRKYSFCKSHAISYAKLVWALSYQKVYNPKQFWLSTLNNCKSMYRTWVHYREAKQAGIKLTLGQGPWKFDEDGETLVPITNLHRTNEKMTTKIQLLKYGYWIDNKFYGKCGINIIDNNSLKVKFSGLIATSRWCRKWSNGICKYFTYVTIGYQNAFFIDLTINKWITLGNHYIIKGEGIFKELDKQSSYGIINVINYTLE